MIEIVRIRGIDEGVEEQIRQLLATVGLAADDLEQTEFFAHFGSRGSLLGIVGYQPAPPDCLLRSLAVDPAHQRKGIATAIMRHALACLAGEFGRVFLYTEGEVGFFRRFSFEVLPPTQVPERISSLPLVAQHCRSEATAMVLDLSPRDSSSASRR